MTDVTEVIDVTDVTDSTTISQVALAELPQLKTLFAAASSELAQVEAFCAQVEAQLSACLRTDSIPTDTLVEAICVTKVRAIEVVSR